MYPRFDSSFMSQTNRYAVNSLFQISRISALVRFSICNLPLRHQILISKEYLEMLELIGAEKVCSFAVRFPLGDEFYPFSNNGEGCTKGPNKRKTEKTRFNGISSNFRGVVVAVTWKIFKQKAGKAAFCRIFCCECFLPSLPLLFQMWMLWRLGFRWFWDPGHSPSSKGWTEFMWVFHINPYNLQGNNASNFATSMARTKNIILNHPRTSFCQNVS